MNRRELLKPLAALIATPVIVKGAKVGEALAIEPGKKYMVFVNPELINVQDLVEHSALPPGTWIHGVFACCGESIDDAIRIYELGKDA